MSVPIVVAAFGTTSRAVQTYHYMDRIFRQRFPENEIHWAYASRMVKDKLKHKQNIDRLHPYEVLSRLFHSGNRWAVVQSLFLTCGHEFYRLVDEVGQSGIRTSIGLPLLYAPQDHAAVINVFVPLVTVHPDEAIVCIGHGTDHPAWTTYTALAHRLQMAFGPKVFMGVVEGGYPDRNAVIQAVRREGWTGVHLLPFMLVAGVHFEEDLAGCGDSWRQAFESAGMRVNVEKNGLGMNPQIVEIFCKHIEAALDVIPANQNSQ